MSGGLGKIFNPGSRATIGNPRVYPPPRPPPMGFSERNMRKMRSNMYMWKIWRKYVGIMWRNIYAENIKIFIIYSSYLLHSYFFIFLGLPRFFLGFGRKIPISFPLYRRWDLKKFRAFSSIIGSGTWKNSKPELPPRLEEKFRTSSWIMGLGKKFRFHGASCHSPVSFI